MLQPEVCIYYLWLKQGPPLTFILRTFTSPKTELLSAAVYGAETDELNVMCLKNKKHKHNKLELFDMLK